MRLDKEIRNLGMAAIAAVTFGLAACQTKNPDLPTIEVLPSVTPSPTETTNYPGTIDALNKLLTAEPTPTASNTLLPTDTASATETHVFSGIASRIHINTNGNNHQESTEIPSILTTNQETPMPTITPLPPVDTLEPLTIHKDQVWTGEFPFNNFVKDLGKTNGLVIAAKLQLYNDLKEYNSAKTQEDKNKILREDATLAGLINNMGAGITSDPITNPGLGQTDKDINDGALIDVLLANKDNMIGSQILSTNSRGITTAEVWVNRNDIDAGIAWLATGLAVRKGLSDNTIPNLWANNTSAATINWWADQFRAQIEEVDLGVSKSEQARRDDVNNTTDASKKLPTILQGSTDAISCDRYETPQNVTDRTLQRLSTRRVDHEEQSNEDFNNANSENEIDLLVVSINENTGVWDFDAYTFRSYEGPVENQKYSASGEEMINCAPRQRATLIPATITPVTFNIATPGQPINTPENHETEIVQTQRATENPTITPQNPEPTMGPATLPAGTPTPVATYENTPMPTQITNPTEPPAQAPSSTPMF